MGNVGSYWSKISLNLYTAQRYLKSKITVPMENFFKRHKHTGKIEQPVEDARAAPLLRSGKL